mgnify:CR=1 FL=1
MTPIALAERGLVPDPLSRLGIRRLLAKTLRDEMAWQADGLNALIDELRASPIAINTADANSQHYELPTEYFRTVLGPRLKYSACYWPTGVNTLDGAELASLELVAERADIRDGMRVLELGCGWGAFSLWLAERYPGCQVQAVSNSATQRAHINAQCLARGITNLAAHTADMNDFEPDAGPFDRIVSIEMFEHMRNHGALMARIRRWLAANGRLFVHIFSHRHLAYPYRAESGDDWMAEYFFAGGIMPSQSLLLYFQDDLRIERHWQLNGRHYQRTLEAWLAEHDRSAATVKALFRDVYGAEAPRWFHRWRLFYMASAELFGFRGGQEWQVSHYRFEPRA